MHHTNHPLRTYLTYLTYVHSRLLCETPQGELMEPQGTHTTTPSIAIAAAVVSKYLCTYTYLMYGSQLIHLQPTCLYVGRRQDDDGPAGFHCPSRYV